MYHYRKFFLLAAFVLAAMPSADAAVQWPPDVLQPHPTKSASTIPERIYENLQRLVDLGLAQLPPQCTDVKSSNLSREEMEDMTLAAMSRLHMKEDGSLPPAYLVDLPAGTEETRALYKALYSGLRNRGMLADLKLLKDFSPSSVADDDKKDEERKWKLSGELRYNYVRNSGDPKWDWNDSRLRLRLFLEGKINDNWHAFGMTEGNKHFLSRGKDDWFDNNRLYIRGITGNTIWTAGWYGYTLGDGNIYDGRVAGITMQHLGKAVYELTAARTNDHRNLMSFGVQKDLLPATYGAALHHFSGNEDVSKKQLIWDAFYHYRFTPSLTGKFMYLGSDLSDKDGRKNGFVLSAVNGKVKSWRRGTEEFELSYYYQPVGTYVAHTMDGLAGYMDGFQGLGMGYRKALIKNTVSNWEYYRLKELTTGKKGNTLWFDTTWYF